MVFYFTAIDGTSLYMGKDKYENEDLIKYGWPEDIWFHVRRKNWLPTIYMYYFTINRADYGLRKSSTSYSKHVWRTKRTMCTLSDVYNEYACVVSNVPLVFCTFFLFCISEKYSLSPIRLHI